MSEILEYKNNGSEGYYVKYYNFPKFDGQTFYSASTNSNTTKFSEYTVDVTIYTATSQYAETTGTTKVTYGTTLTHYYYTTLNNVSLLGKFISFKFIILHLLLNRIHQSL